MTLDEILSNPEILQAGIDAVEKSLIEFKESRISQMCFAGFVIHEMNNGYVQRSNIIRFDIKTGLIIALKAMEEINKS